MEQFADDVDVTFGWDFNALSAEQVMIRAATFATLVLFECHPDEARSELLQTKLFVLLCLERYRSHAERLFEYTNGVWTKCARIGAAALEWISTAVRMAQSFFLLMGAAVPAPKRSRRSVIRELRIIHAKASSILVKLMPFETDDSDTTLWCYQCSALCTAMFKTFSGFTTAVTANFHRWGGTDMHRYAQRGIASPDAYMETAGRVMRQRRKAPYRNCYVMIPVELHWTPPDWARNELRKLFTTTFAKSDGLSAFVDMNTLAYGRQRMAEVILVPYGEGRDGKSMVFSDLMKATWGDACGLCPGTMLQVEREFQQQGHRFIDCIWLSFDESNRERGVQEDVVKMFGSNMLMPLRRNHEAETHDGDFSRAGRCFAMNISDIPWIPPAQEISHARRYLGTYHRATFLLDEDRLNAGICIFKARPDYKEFAKSGLAAVIFIRDYIARTKKETTPAELRNRLEFPDPSSILAKDSAYLHARMARATSALSPDHDASIENLAEHATITGAVSDLIRRALVAMTSSESPFKCTWVLSDIVRTICKRRPQTLSDAAGVSQYFLRIFDGTRMYKGRPIKMIERRRLNLVTLESILGEHADRDDVFGTFNEWFATSPDLYSSVYRSWEVPHNGALAWRK